MSYILDALRKSDQQRRRGAAPTLLAGQVTAVTPKQPAVLAYGLLAAVLVGAGVVIGWLRPWQAEQAAPAATQSDASVRQSVPVRTEIAAAPAPALARAPLAAPAPAPVQVPAAVPVPAPASVKSLSPASVGAEAPGKPQDDVAAVSRKAAAVAQQPPVTAAADSAPAQNVISLAELPLALQQELPPMTISVHAYSGNPRDRMVGINNRMLREGDDVAPGLKLEQITPEGMIFGYKGYSFRRGVK
ncbi:MAG: general secretion pathway protein GspB [Betaproteobacteria bacterium]|nr:general secretion pathway protein GspB [Betaproteobacteria bacterium]